MGKDRNFILLIKRRFIFLKAKEKAKMFFSPLCLFRCKIYNSILSPEELMKLYSVTAKSLADFICSFTPKSFCSL